MARAAGWLFLAAAGTATAQPGIPEEAAAGPADATGARTPAASPSAGASMAGGPADPPALGELFPDGAAPEEAPPDMAQNVTINLLKIFVQKGYLSQMEAVGLIRQAENEALAARQASQARKAAEAAAEDEAMQVSYVPEVVRTQMQEEIRRQVLADLQAAPAGGKGSSGLSGLPEFVASADVFGDIRLRYELVDFPEGNDNTGAFSNFNSINTGAPFDTAGLVFSPQRNVDQERMRYRLRVRLGGEWQLSDGFSAGIRLATGENNSPVTTNQGLGTANGGQGGNFSKYAVWLDRAFIKYHTDFGTESTALDVLGGRFDNPFFSTEAIFDEDLGFDGLALKLRANKGGKFSPYLTAGAFPIFNTDFNFSSNQPAKFESTDRYLFAAQAGADFKISEDLKLKLGLAYYNFDQVQGELSEPFLPLSASDAGPTDNTRPSFAQSGNTYQPLRQIIADPSNNFGTSSQFQYFGLASQFTPVVISAKLDYTGFEPAQVSLFGEYIKNTAFDRNAIERVAVNNRGPLPAESSIEGDDATSGPSRFGLFDGDDTAWLAGVKFGKIAMAKRGDWTLGVNYRWIGSDAVVDGFNDSDFGGGGTNVKGFVFSGSYAISPNAAFGVQYLSSDQIAGPPLRSDILQVDFRLKF